MRRLDCLQSDLYWKVCRENLELLPDFNRKRKRERGRDSNVYLGQTYQPPEDFSSTFALFAFGLVSLSGESSTANTLSMSASKNEFKALCKVNKGHYKLNYSVNFKVNKMTISATTCSLMYQATAVPSWPVSVYCTSISHSFSAR